MIQPKYQNYLVVSLSVLAVGVTMAMVQYKVPTIMIAIMEQYAMTASGGSWLMSIFTLMMAVTAIAIGELSVRMSPKRIIVFATCLIVLGSVMGAFAPNGVVLLVSARHRGHSAHGGDHLWPTGHTGKCRTRAYRHLHGYLGHVGIFGLRHRRVSDAIGLRVCGAHLALALLLCAGRDRDRHHVHLRERSLQEGFAVALEDAVNAFEGAAGVAQSDVTPDEASVPRTEAKPSYRELLTKDVLLFFCGFVAFNICLLAVLSLVPSILQMRGMDVSLSGFVSTLPMIISVASSPFFGMLSDKTGKTKWLLVFCLLFLGPCTFVLYNFEGAVMWAGAVVMGVIGMGTTRPHDNRLHEGD